MSAYSDLVLRDRPLAYWPLTEPIGGTIANDWTGHHFDAVAHGSSLFTTGGVLPGENAWFGNNIASNYLEIVSASGLPLPAHAQSWEAWIKPTVFDEGFAMCWLFLSDLAAVWWLIDNNEFASNLFSGHNFTFAFQYLFHTIGGNFCDHLWSSCQNCTSFAPALTGPQVETIASDVYNQWNHIALTWDGIIGNWYINGLLVPALNNQTWVGGLFAGPKLDYSTQTWGPYQTAWLAGAPIIYHSGTHQTAWGGGLNHVAVYDYGLKPCQVLAHYDLATTGLYIPCKTAVRLTVAPGGAVRQMIAPGSAQRLTINE